ncbi:MAG: ActR/RegA family two-component response regulator [Myxococcota bacterium]|jgi:ActR/RegA family two-component response regulator
MDLYPKPRSILVVEDDEYDMALVVRLLQDSRGPKFTVQSATSLADARKLLSETHYDATIADLGLADSRGLETVRALASTAPRTALVVLTGDETMETALEAVRMGAQDYVAKPSLTWEVLHRVVQHAMDRQRLLNGLSRRYAAWTMVVHTLRGLDEGPDLRRRAPESFEELAQLHAGLLAVTAHGRDRDQSHEQHLGELTRRLVELDAGIGDLLDVHLAAVGRRLDAESQAGRTREEEQLLIFEVMGHLLAGYRSANREARRQRAPRGM